MDQGANQWGKSVFDLTDKQLEQIAFYAECQMTLKEIALILGFNSVDFLKEFDQANTKLFSAIQTGRLKAKAGIYKSIMDCAKHGSHPAQNVALKLMRTTQSNDNEPNS